MATKLGRMVTYERNNSPVMSDDPQLRDHVRPSLATKGTGY